MIFATLIRVRIKENVNFCLWTLPTAFVLKGGLEQNVNKVRIFIYTALHSVYFFHVQSTPYQADTVLIIADYR